MGRSEKYPDVRVVSAKEVVRLLGGVTGSVVPDEVDASGVAMVPKQLRQYGSQAVPVVSLQVPAAHAAGVHHELGQEVHRATPYVLELPAFVRPGRMSRAGCSPCSTWMLGFSSTHNTTS